MNMENQFGNNQNKAEEKKTEIETISANDYLNMIKENPVKIKEVGDIEDWNNNRKRIESVIENDRISRRMKDFSDNGLLEEVGYLPLKYKENGMIDDEESEKIYSSNEEKGYSVQSVPIYGEDGNVTGHKYYRGKEETFEDKKEIKTNLELKYQKEYNDKWFYEEQMKDKEFQEKVRGGELVYLGEISFDDYIKLRKNGFPYGVTEEVWMFDENKNPIRDIMKYYAHVSKPE
jgi:hypothetical protein